MKQFAQEREIFGEHSQPSLEEKKDAPIVTSEQKKTMDVKTKAVQRTLFLQFGLSSAMMIEGVGLLFFPFFPYWSYLLVISQFLINVGVVTFICLLLFIFRPLRDVQSPFKNPKDERKVIDLKAKEATLVVI